VVPQRLAIHDGPIVDIDGRPAQGTRHEIMFGVLAAGGEPAVVKVERIPGALDRERSALVWLGTAAPGMAPILVAFGDTTVDGERVSCLVTERCSGSPPATVDGWERMGGALARLTEVGHPDGLLPRLEPDEFVTAHHDRVRELGAQLDPFVEPIPDWSVLTRRTLPTATMMVLTHGDPGPGNYLDTGSTGTLVDCFDSSGDRTDRSGPRPADVHRAARLRACGIPGKGSPGSLRRRRTRVSQRGCRPLAPDGRRPPLVAISRGDPVHPRPVASWRETSAVATGSRGPARRLSSAHNLHT
jgi:hypothetical protein